ncbi:MAG: universal stress protein [Microbacteriaceae bacterium]|jgi:nucleotide-binding universal stress UspA family protein|nr:universal stress protein [Microbacteriaceae bacterium]
MSEHRTPRIIVGVFPGQPESVIRHAAVFAERFGAELVCAWADSSRYVTEEGPDGIVESMPLDPDLADVEDAGFPEGYAAEIGRLLDPLGVTWSTRDLAGQPARALEHLSAAIQPIMIVVGSRRANARATVQEFFTGSVASHLAHRQRQPVVVIPLTPVASDEELPWRLG